MRYFQKILKAITIKKYPEHARNANMREIQNMRGRPSPGGRTVPKDDRREVLHTNGDKIACARSCSACCTARPKFTRNSVGDSQNKLKSFPYADIWRKHCSSAGFFFSLCSRRRAALGSSFDPRLAGPGSLDAGPVAASLTTRLTALGFFFLFF